MSVWFITESQVPGPQLGTYQALKNICCSCTFKCYSLFTACSKPRPSLQTASISSLKGPWLAPFLSRDTNHRPRLSSVQQPFPCLRGCRVAQSCPSLCDPTDYSPPGSSVHGILQARILEWVAISFSILCISASLNANGYQQHFSGYL